MNASVFCGVYTAINYCVKCKKDLVSLLSGINPANIKIKKAIFFHLKDGNAAGPDGVPAGAKEADVNTSKHTPGVLCKPGGSRCMGHLKTGLGHLH